VNNSILSRAEAEDEVDQHGIKVIVGHYVGDISNEGFPINLTDGKYAYKHKRNQNRTRYSPLLRYKFSKLMERRKSIRMK